VWTASGGENDNVKVTADSVLLVPGGVPMTHDDIEGVESIECLKAAIPGHLDLSKGEEKVVSIVGNSHTGMLVAQNFLTSSTPPRKVNVISLNSLVFAERRVEDDGLVWTKNDGTGLKGTVAEWVRDAGRGQDGEGVEMVIVKEQSETKGAIERLGTEVVCYATGFVRSGLPDLIVEGERRNDMYDKYDGFSGRIAGGLYGAGIGFPERWTDPEGESEYRVGFNVVYKEHLCRIADEMARE